MNHKETKNFFKVSKFPRFSWTLSTEEDESRETAESNSVLKSEQRNISRKAKTNSLLEPDFRQTKTAFISFPVLKKDYKETLFILPQLILETKKLGLDLLISLSLPDRIHRNFFHLFRPRRKFLFQDLRRGNKNLKKKNYHRVRFV